MSTGRAAAIARAEDAIAGFSPYDLHGESPLDTEEMARAVINAVLPEIREPREMRGVPEGSILISMRPSVTVYHWKGGDLHKLQTGGGPPGEGAFNPSYIVRDWGPLTVVWMP